MGFIISGTVPTPQTHYFATLSAGGQSFSESASALDSSGNMYVAGSYQAQFQGDTYFMLVKFNSLGSLQWQKRLPVLNMSIGSIAIDSSGNVYVGGRIGASAQYSSNQLIVKFDSSGNYVWKKQFGDGNTGPGSSSVLQIAISSADDIYVTGSIKGGGTYGNLYSYISLVKYNTSGDVQWQRSLNQSGSQVTGNGVTIDSSGNIYVVGSGQWSGYDSYNNAIIAKYSSTGTLLWQQAVAGTSSVSMGFTKTACDSSGNVYAVATANFSSATPKVVIVKYNSSGTVQWSRQWGTTGTNNQMSVGSIKIDSSDNLYISGSTYNSITSNFEDSIIAKYNSSGAIQWQRYINAPNMGSGPQLHVDNLNNFYIATDSNKNGNKWVVAKLPTDGSKTATYSPGGASYSLIYGTASLSETSFSTNVITPTLTNTTSTYPAGDATIGDMSTTTWSAAVVTSASAGDAGPFGTFVGGTPPPNGQQAYTTPGTYSWTAPAGVTSVSVVAVGGGASGALNNSTSGNTAIAGGGGGLGWKNNITVVPGQTYTVVVGAAGSKHYGASSYTGTVYGNRGEDSYFINTTTVKGGGAGVGATAEVGGTYVGDGGGNGGNGRGGWQQNIGAGGGAGGYSGNGGNGTSYSSQYSDSNGSGGGGGGGGGVVDSSTSSGYGGGGVGILGQGASGTMGSWVSLSPPYTMYGSGGGGGSGGSAAGAWARSDSNPGSSGGSYGGGGGAWQNIYSSNGFNGAGAGGAVRIIWGTNRAFPSTGTTDVSGGGGITGMILGG